MSLPGQKPPTPTAQPTVEPTAQPTPTLRPTHTLAPAAPAAATPETSTCPLLTTEDAAQAVGQLKGAPAEAASEGSLRQQADVFGQTCTLSTESGAQYQVFYRGPAYWFLYIPDDEMMRQRLLDARTVPGLGERAYQADDGSGGFILTVIDKTQGVMMVTVSGGSLDQAKALVQVAFDHVASK